jgi:hypothetical protein
MRPFLIMAAICHVLSSAADAEPFEATVTTDTESGSVKYELPGTTTYKDLAWKATVKVPVGTIVKTTSDGVAKVDIFPGGRMLVLPGSSFKVASLSVQTAGDTIAKRQGRIDLDAGTLKVLLSHKGENSSPIDFSIKTPNGVAAAKGTKYVDCYVGGVTYVQVIDGTVYVKGTVNGILVYPGQIAEITPEGLVKLVAFASLPPGVQISLSQAVQITATDGLPTVNASDAAGSEHSN